MRRKFSIVLCLSFLLSFHAQGEARENQAKLSHKQKQELKGATHQGDVASLIRLLSPPAEKARGKAKNPSFLSKGLFEKNKLMPRGIGWSPKSETTTTIVYEIFNGVLCHIGVYPDVCVATALNGSESGTQYIVNTRGTLVSVSTVFGIYEDHVDHLYGWGKVSSYGHAKQKIKVK